MKSMKNILNITLLVFVATFWAHSMAFAVDVMTVLGPIPAEKLGVTLMHEHVAAGWVGSDRDSRAPYDRTAAEKVALKTFMDLKAIGVTTFVDTTPCDITLRDPVLFQSLSKKSGINIIMSTGMYMEKEGANTYWKYRQAVMGESMEQELYELFMKEIRVGVGNTGIKAGLIKVSSDDPAITDFEKVCFKAAVRASLETGVPIITHTQGDTVGPAQQKLFLSLGGNPKKIMIGHMNNSDDINYHLYCLARPDFYIGFDRISLAAPWGKIKSEDCMIELVKKGYADRIMLAHDSIATWPGKTFKWPAAMVENVKDWYPTYIHKKLIPKMKAAGVTDEQIHTMLVDNPRRFFNGE